MSNSSIGRTARSLAALAVIAAANAVVFAHPLSVSYSRFAVDDRTVDAVVRLPLDDVDLLLRLDKDLDGAVTAAEIDGARTALERYFSDRIQVRAAGHLLAPVLHGTATWKDSDGFPYVEARLTYAAPSQIDGVEFTVRVLTDLYTDHRNLSEIEFAGRRHEFVFQHGSAFSAEDGGGWAWQTAKSFLLLGLEHIFTGYDHILFLFGLLLVGSGVRNLVAVVTSFTVAHSVTLSLATLGLVQPTAWTVEAAIALTVAYVGLENVLVSNVQHRWRITFVFGLIHGFGFAHVLQEMELPRRALAASLLTFNIGVEMGQVAIVLLMLPLLRFLERTSYRVPVVRAASVMIAAVGLFWFWQRIV